MSGYTEIKIDSSDTLYTCDRYGNIGRTISTNVRYAVFNEDNNTFLVTKLDGSVHTLDKYGNSIRKIFSGAVEARYMDNDILVRTNEGNKIIDIYGNILRSV